MTSPAKVLLLIKRIEVEAVSNCSVTVRPLSIEKSVNVAVDGNVLIEAVSNGSVTVRPLSIEKSVSVAVDGNVLIEAVSNGSVTVPLFSYKNL